MKKSIFLVLGILCLSSCGEKPSVEDSINPISTVESATSVETPSPSLSIEEDNRVNVFLLAGQSNMEGNTRHYPYLSRYLASNEEEGDYDFLKSVGFDNVMISYYNHYSDSRFNYSNKTTPIDGAFVPVKLNQGVDSSNFFGPEIGMACVLDEYVGDNNTNPVFLIKYTAGATGFCNGWNKTDNNWRSESEDRPGDLFYGLIEYTFNCLNLIEDEGFEPVVRGFCWMQGEADSGNATLANAYKNHLENLVNDVRDYMADYSPNNDPDQIAFIDAYISDKSAWTCHNIINGAKKDIAESSDMNFVIDTNSNGIDLYVDKNQQNGGDQYHYGAADMLKLGKAFGNIMVENNLLDF